MLDKGTWTVARYCEHTQATLLSTAEVQGARLELSDLLLGLLAHAALRLLCDLLLRQLALERLNLRCMPSSALL